MPEEVAPGNLHDILHALDALRPSLGKKRLSLLLRGSVSKLGTDRACPLFGVMSVASRTQVDGFIDLLVMRGLLRQGDEDEYFVYTVTQAGREAWRERADLAISVPGLMPVSRSTTVESDALPVDVDLYERLRAWRRMKARDLNLPPYMVFGDRTLRAIAVHKPTTSGELLVLPGIGESKLTQYGDEILTVVNAEAIIVTSGN